MKYMFYINEEKVDFLTFLKEIADSEITPEYMDAVMGGFPFTGKYGLIFKMKTFDD